MASDADIGSLLAEFDDLPTQASRGRRNSRTLSQPATPPPHSHSVTPPPRHLQHARSSGGYSASNLDDLLQDLDIPSAPPLCNVSLHPLQSKGPAGPPQPSYKARQSTSQVLPKCSSLYLGGTRCECGRNGSTVGVVSVCDSIRCTKCDFRVMAFPDTQWLPSVDYLFFRNNYPDADKLAAKLQSRQVCRSYCCQCSWFSTVGEYRIDFGGELRWVCAGH